MTRAMLMRLLQAIPTMLGVSLVVFLFLAFSPVPIQEIIGADATPQAIAAKRAELFLDRPLYERYFRWLWDAVRLDFGTSYFNNRNVSEIIVERLPATLELAACTMFVAMLVSVVVAILSVRKPNGVFDTASRSVIFVFLAMPGFWLGVELIIIFSRKLGWLPPGGRMLRAPETLADVAEHLSYLVLPSLTLGIGIGAALCRVLRASLLEILNSDFVRTAKAKGLSGRVVLMKHALRNALIPFATLSGLSVAGLLEGSVIVENVFSWPGIGTMMIEAIRGRDAPIAMAGVLVAAAIYVTINLLVDVLYVVIDPRVRLDGGAGK